MMNLKTEIVRMRKEIHCPSCGKSAAVLIEIYHGHSITFECDGRTRSEEGICSEGSPHHVEAKCRCGKQWRLRGVMQITDLDKE